MNDLLFSDLQASMEDHVLTLTLNRPEKRNALSARLINELIIAFETAATDDNVRVIVLTGSGGAFCAGADLSLIGGTGGEDSDFPHRGGFPELNLAMVAVHKPIIARVERYAMAGALALICGSTFVIAEDTARFGAPEIDRGIFPMMVLASLFRTVSKRDGLDLVLTGRKIDAAEAVRMGLINQAVPADVLDETVSSLATTLASKPPAAIQMGLAAFHDQHTLEFEAALSMLQERLMAVLNTEDAQEGILAFLQKREPEWTGR
jgi:enoyl-CoA hydratase/carnithine racemase